MSDQTPATPAASAAATPGVPANVITTPSTPPAAPEGKVTISTDEFAKLSRDAARGRSLQRRNDFTGNKNRTPEIEGGDPDVNKTIREANDRAAAAEKKAMQLEVRTKVSELLNKEEFKKIPQSTKELILKNPAVISQAETIEESMLDIEDYLVETVGKIDLGMGGSLPKVDGDSAPVGVRTPPSAPGAPAKSDAIELEDTSKLTGTARSTAAIRNAMKKANGVV